MTVLPSYPIFLWITWCKILFIVGDQNWKRFFQTVQYAQIVKKRY
ncbi:hypothetical protein [Cedecea colo]